MHALLPLYGMYQLVCPLHPAPFHGYVSCLQAEHSHSLVVVCCTSVMGKYIQSPSSILSQPCCSTSDVLL